MEVEKENVTENSQERRDVGGGHVVVKKEVIDNNKVVGDHHARIRTLVTQQKQGIRKKTKGLGNVAFWKGVVVEKNVTLYLSMLIEKGIDLRRDREYRKAIDLFRKAMELSSEGYSNYFRRATRVLKKSIVMCDRFAMRSMVSKFGKIRIVGDTVDGIVKIFSFKSNKKNEFLRFKGHFQDGRMDGLGKEFSKNGAVISEGVYENNCCVFPKKSFEDLVQQKIQIKDISRLARIAQSPLSSVYKFERKKKLYAFKLFTTEDITPVKLEIELSLRLRHPNIVRGYFYLANDKMGRYGLILEMCDTNVHMVIEEELSVEKELRMKIGQKLDILIGVCRGMEHLHKLNIIHRDLKWSNVLLKGNVPKVMDMGESKLVTLKNRTVMTGFVGTPYFIAPEVLAIKTTKKSSGLKFEAQIPYGKSCDSYSFGIMMFQLVFLKTTISMDYLFYPRSELTRYRDNPAELPRILTDPDCQPRIDPEWVNSIRVRDLVKLMKRCYSYLPKKRLKFTQIRRELEKIKSMGMRFQDNLLDVQRRYVKYTDITISVVENFGSLFAELKTDYVDFIDRRGKENHKKKNILGKCLYKAIVFDLAEYGDVMATNVVLSANAPFVVPWMRRKSSHDFFQYFVKKEQEERTKKTDFRVTKYRYYLVLCRSIVALMEFLDMNFGKIFVGKKFAFLREFEFQKGVGKKVKKKWAREHFFGTLALDFFALLAENNCFFVDLSPRRMSKFVDLVLKKDGVKLSTHSSNFNGNGLFCFLILNIMKRKMRMNLYYSDLFVLGKLLRHVLVDFRDITGHVLIILHNVFLKHSLSGISREMMMIAGHSLFLCFGVSHLVEPISSFQENVKRVVSKAVSNPAQHAFFVIGKTSNFVVLLTTFSQGGILFDWNRSEVVRIDPLCRSQGARYLMKINDRPVYIEKSFVYSLVAELYWFNCFSKFRSRRNTGIDFKSDSKNNCHEFCQKLMKGVMKDKFCSKVAGNNMIYPSQKVKKWKSFLFKSSGAIIYVPEEKILIGKILRKITKDLFAVFKNEGLFVNEEKVSYANLKKYLGFVFVNRGKLDFFLKRLFRFPKKGGAGIHLELFPKAQKVLRMIDRAFVLKENCTAVHQMKGIGLQRYRNEKMDTFPWFFRRDDCFMLRKDWCEGDWRQNILWSRIVTGTCTVSISTD